MDDILKKQLEMYERGDIDALEQILTSTMSALPQDDEEVTIVSEAITFTPHPSSNANFDDDEPSEIPNSTTYAHPSYPALTKEVKEDISRLTKEWIRLDEGLLRIRKMKTEFEKERKVKNQRLLEYIEKYGLKDITKGRHQLVPQIKKGCKKGFTKDIIKDKLSDFLNTLEIIDDAEVREVAMQASDYLDNTRGRGADIIELKHNRL